MILLSSGLGLGSLKEFIAFALAIETTPSELQHRLVCVVFGFFLESLDYVWREKKSVMKTIVFSGF